MQSFIPLKLYDAKGNPLQVFLPIVTTSLLSNDAALFFGTTNGQVPSSTPPPRFSASLNGLQPAPEIPSFPPSSFRNAASVFASIGNGIAKPMNASAPTSIAKNGGHLLPVSEAPPVPLADTTLYVSNLPENIAVERVRSEFAAFGTIVSCRLARRSFKKSRPVAFVQFTHPDMVQRAIRGKHGTMMDGRRLAVRVAEAAKEKETAARPCANLYVANLPGTCTEASLRALFGPYGHIDSVVVFTDRTTGLCKGTAMVRFPTTEEARAAIQGLHRRTPPGLRHPLMVRYADADPKSRRAPKGSPGTDGDSPPAADLLTPGPPPFAQSAPPAALASSQGGPVPRPADRPPAPPLRAPLLAPHPHPLPWRSPPRTLLPHRAARPPSSGSSSPAESLGPLPDRSPTPPPDLATLLKLISDVLPSNGGEHHW